MTNTLAGKTALVTGASRGIGRATAQRLEQDGARVAVHYGSNREAAEATVASILAAGGAAFAVGAPLGGPGDAEALWDAFDTAAGGDTTLALELGPRGITVHSVEPGVVDTDIAGWLEDPQLRRQAESWSAFERVGVPADVADIVAFLASGDARWVTGQYLDATGGLWLGPELRVEVAA